jgi:hypothetical protein
VVGDVAAASGLVNLDMALFEELRRGKKVRPGGVQLHAKRDDVRVLDKEQKVGHARGTALFHERALHLHTSRVRNDTELPYFQGRQS